MSFTDYLLFIGIAALQVGSPGPSTLFLINNALVYGPTRAIGVLSGDLLAIALLAGCALLGVDAVLTANPGLFTAVKLAGATYLVWLGIQQFRQATAPRPDGKHATHRQGLASLWAKSFMVGISNPKAILFFSSLLPQFVDPQGADTYGVLSLILLFVLVKLLVSSGYACAAKKMANLLARPGAGRWGKRLAGVVLVAFGAVMGVEAFR